MTLSTAAVPKPPLTQLSAPAPLRNLPGWLVWKFEPGDTKPRKVPYYANGGRRHGQQGRTEDRRQLTTFEVARAAARGRGFDGVGFALLPDWNITALDFDGCVSDDGVHPDVLAAVAGTYAELSPSGRGVRAFVIGALGNRKDHGGCEAFGFETFSDAGFVTITGDTLPLVELLGLHDTITAPNDAALALIAKRFGRANVESTSGETAPLGLTEARLREALDVLDPSMPHDPWLRIGMALHHETSGEGFYLWDEWSSRGATYPGSAQLHGRWESFGRGDHRPVTVHYLVNLSNEQGAHIDLSELALADFDVVDVPAVDMRPNRFAVEPLDVFVKRPPPEWIIKGVLPRAELVVLFGESGAGKSFVALDLAGAIARGIEWRGLRVKQARIVYVAAEGAGGFRNRVAAYCQRHDINAADMPIGVIHVAPNLLLHADAIEVSKAIVASGGADVVIVDTFAQVTPGANENAAEDMGKALSHCKGIHRATGAVVLLVHHSGKDASRGARGWSGLKAAADAELEVLRMPGGRVLRTSKQKDGEDGLQWGFDLDVMQIGVDEDDDAITSCVVREAAIPVVQKVMGRELGEVEVVVDEVIREFAVAQSTGIEVKAVIAEAARRLPEPEEGKRDTRKQRASRSLKALCKGDAAAYWEEDGCIEVLS